MANNALRSAVFPSSRVNVANRQQPSERHPIRLAAQASTAPRGYRYMVRGGAIATAASAALPPCSSTRRPTRVTSGELELAMASPANTGERRCRKAGLSRAEQVLEKL